MKTPPSLDPIMKYFNPVNIFTNALRWNSSGALPPHLVMPSFRWKGQLYLPSSRRYPDIPVVVCHSVEISPFHFLLCEIILRSLCKTWKSIVTNLRLKCITKYFVCVSTSGLQSVNCDSVSVELPPFTSIFAAS